MGLAKLKAMLPYVTSPQTADFLNGALFLVDKPKGWTSFDAVHKIRNLIIRKINIKKIKVGHSGTLDPMATGLLLICTGAWTKELHQLQGLDKKYKAEITLGIETDSYDTEGNVIEQKEVPPLTVPDLLLILSKFTGEYQQMPPVFSAIKKDGKPLYKSARAGTIVTPDPRTVNVYSIEIIDFKENKLQLDIHCASGFYVRSLAHDIGAELNCGAHLSALVRTMIGPYDLSDAWQMEELIEMMQ